MEKDNKNYYDVLELIPSCTQEDIEKAYMRSKNAYAPESAALYSLMSAQECADMLNQVEEAYDILSSPYKRRQYDEIRGFVPKVADEEVRQAPKITLEQLTVPTIDSPQNSGGLSKIVSRQQFTLEYPIDPAMEAEIEKTTEFTGPFLKRIREYKNVDVQRMAAMTKVSRTYLTKIESEDMVGMPALVYVRGFVYQYAKCLKLNPDLVATSYLHHMRKFKER